MCLNPIRIINPKAKIRLDGGENYLISVPCGQCAECVYLKRKEARMRAYYEFKDTLTLGGCVYFETLTYRPKDLPRLSDIIPELKGDKMNVSCFRKKDVTDYIKRVRETLFRMGYKRRSIKYFVTSEYGSDKEYKDDKGRLRKGTKRPHYHIIWYFLYPNCDDLVKVSNECWNKGRTDVLNANKHIFKKGKYDDFEHMMSICGYVAKYVTKDKGYNNKIGNVIEKLTNKYNLSEEEIEKLKKSTEMYHRWSNGFGIAGIKYNEEKDLNEKMRIKIPHKKKVWDYLKLPNYYKRKLHYDLIKLPNKKYKWVLKKECINNYINREYESTKLYYFRIKDFINNIDKYVKEGDIFDKKRLNSKEVHQKIKEMKEEIERLRNGRKLWDFAEYQTRYKGRLRLELTDDNIELKYSVNDNDNCHVSEIATNFAHKCYKVLPYRFVAVGYDIKDEIDKLIENGITPSKEYMMTRCNHNRIIDCNTFAKIATINQMTATHYRDYDNLEKFISYCLSAHNRRCQMTADEMEAMQKRLKDAQGG